MKTPKKIYLQPLENNEIYNHWYKLKLNNDFIEYTRTDAFIKKAKAWFEKQPELYDANGIRCYSMEDFEDFKNYMEGE